MATINVMVGQCGTQLGAAFLHALAEEATTSRDDEYQRKISQRFFRSSSELDLLHGSLPVLEEAKAVSHRPVARAVLIDMEPKVIDDCVATANRRGLFQFSSERQAVTKSEGSANNWAFGFSQQGPSKREEIVDAVRQEVEHCDESTLSAIQMFHSTAGGTGAGVGSFVSQQIRDEFPLVPLHHTVVWPFEHGELTTQWFNALHTLQHVNEYADSIHMLSNNSMSELIKHATAGGSLASLRSRAELSDINDLMCEHLAALHLPRRVAEVPPAAELHRRSKLISAGKALTDFTPAVYQEAHWTDVVESLVLDPRRKFFESYTLPSSARWSMDASVASSPGRGLHSGTADLMNSWGSVLSDPLRWGSRNGSHSSLIVLRGSKALEEGSVDLQGALRHNALPSLSGLHVASAPFKKRPVQAALYTTNRTLAEKFSSCSEKVQIMLEAGAFLHHFERYGITKEMFDDALLGVENIVVSYEDARW